jgi:hypothetical protein
MLYFALYEYVTSDSLRKEPALKMLINIFEIGRDDMAKDERNLLGHCLNLYLSNILRVGFHVLTVVVMKTSVL